MAEKEPVKKAMAIPSPSRMEVGKATVISPAQQALEKRLAEAAAMKKAQSERLAALAAKKRASGDKPKKGHKAETPDAPSRNKAKLEVADAQGRGATTGTVLDQLSAEEEAAAARQALLDAPVDSQNKRVISALGIKERDIKLKMDALRKPNRIVTETDIRQLQQWRAEVDVINQNLNVLKLSDEETALVTKRLGSITHELGKSEGLAAGRTIASLVDDADDVGDAISVSGNAVTGETGPAKRTVARAAAPTGEDLDDLIDIDEEGKVKKSEFKKLGTPTQDEAAKYTDVTTKERATDYLDDEIAKQHPGKPAVLATPEGKVVGGDAKFDEFVKANALPGETAEDTAARYGLGHARHNKTLPVEVNRGFAVDKPFEPNKPLLALPEKAGGPYYGSGTAYRGERPPIQFDEKTGKVYMNTKGPKFQQLYMATRGKESKEEFLQRMFNSKTPLSEGFSTEMRNPGETKLDFAKRMLKKYPDHFERMYQEKAAFESPQKFAQRYMKQEGAGRMAKELGDEVAAKATTEARAGFKASAEAHRAGLGKMSKLKRGALRVLGRGGYKTAAMAIPIAGEVLAGLEIASEAYNQVVTKEDEKTVRRTVENMNAARALEEGGIQVNEDILSRNLTEYEDAAQRGQRAFGMEALKANSELESIIMSKQRSLGRIAVQAAPDPREIVANMLGVVSD